MVLTDSQGQEELVGEDMRAVPDSATDSSGDPGHITFLPAAVQWGRHGLLSDRSQH